MIKANQLTIVCNDMCCHLLWVIKLQQKADSCLSTKTNHWKYSSIMKHSIMVLSITQHHHDTMTPSHGEGGGEKDFVVSPWDHEISHGDNEIAHGLMVMVGKKSCPPPHQERISWSHGETMRYLVVTMRKLMVSPWASSWSPRGISWWNCRCRKFMKYWKVSTLTYLMLLSPVMMVRSRHTKSSVDHTQAEQKGSRLQKELWKGSGGC